jgi:hypothetical protein
MRNSDRVREQIGQGSLTISATNLLAGAIDGIASDHFTDNGAGGDTRLEHGDVESRRLTNSGPKGESNE